MNTVVVDDSAGKKPENTRVIEYDPKMTEVFLSFYKKIHEKNEEVQKIYSENILIKFGDIKELHNKTIQQIDSLHPERGSISIRIAISHNEGESELFNSFEAFESHNVTSPNPTLDIELRYSFLLKNTYTQEFGVFVVKNRIRSRIAQLSQAEKESEGMIPGFLLARLVTPTAQISIQHSDYVKARSFTAMFDEWIKGCEESRNSKIYSSFKKHSHLIPKIGNYILILLIAWLTVKSIDIDISSIKVGVQFLVAYASIFLFLVKITEHCLRMVEISIDSHIAISYININKGDDKLIKKYQDRNKKFIRNNILNLTLTMIISVLSCFVYDLVKWIVS
jgi:hypothetical protein